MTYELFEVGGKVRDELLGLRSKDVDYAVVLESLDNWTAEEGFKWLENQLQIDGYEIFLSTPDCFTIRAMFPKVHKYSGVADFVLARHEVGYVEGTRTPISVLGNLEEDLKRRDFTVNTLARDSQGNLIDMFDGQKDLMSGILRTPLDAAISFNNDPLRIIRGLRFMVTKGFGLADTVIETIESFDAQRMNVVSDERIREELHKMFHKNTERSMQVLYWLNQINPMLHMNIFSRDMWLMPTNKK